MYKTNHRKLLIDIFEENKNKSFTTTYLVDNLKDSMNKTTIYRQLKLLEEEKIIRKMYNDEVQVYEYQYYKNCDNHLHLKCKNCGRITHLTCMDASIFIHHILETHGFSIDQLTSTLYGTCKEFLSC